MAVGARQNWERTARASFCRWATLWCATHLCKTAGLLLSEQAVLLLSLRGTITPWRSLSHMCLYKSCQCTVILWLLTGAIWFCWFSEQQRPVTHYTPPNWMGLFASWNSGCCFQLWEYCFLNNSLPPGLLDACFHTMSLTTDLQWITLLSKSAGEDLLFTCRMRKINHSFRFHVL